MQGRMFEQTFKNIDDLKYNNFLEAEDTGVASMNTHQHKECGQ